jgi:hypothetical protein
MKMESRSMTSYFHQGDRLERRGDPLCPAMPAVSAPPGLTLPVLYPNSGTPVLSITCTEHS